MPGRHSAKQNGIDLTLDVSLLKDFSKLIPGEKEQYARNAAQGERPAKLTNQPTAGMQAAGFRAPTGQDPYPQRSSATPDVSTAPKPPPVTKPVAQQVAQKPDNGYARTKAGFAQGQREFDQRQDGLRFQADLARRKSPQPQSQPKPPMVAQKAVTTPTGQGPKVTPAPKIGLDIGPVKVVPAPPSPIDLRRRKGTVDTSKAEIDDQHQVLTEKLQRRAQGGGKRASRRAQLAAFGKAGETAERGVRSRGGAIGSISGAAVGRTLRDAYQGRNLAGSAVTRFGITTVASKPSRISHKERERLRQKSLTKALAFHLVPGGSHSDETHHGTYEVHSKPKMLGGGKKHVAMYYPFKNAKGESKYSEKKLSTHSTIADAHAAAWVHHQAQAAIQAKLPVARVVSKKSFSVVSIADYYDTLMKADTPAGSPAPTPGVDAPRPKKFPRKLKPTVKMKPVSDQEAIANLRAGKFYEKSLVMLAAIKALVSGYGKVSGGGALRAPNRGFMSVTNLNRAMQAMPKPRGVSPKPTVKLPGVHGPETEYAKKPPPIPKKKTSPIEHVMGTATKAEMPDSANMLSSMEEPTLKKQKNVVNKAEGAEPMSKTNFNDLFKSELGVANDDVLVDCPHCEVPITKSDLAKAHKGKGAATHVTGPKEVDGDAHVVKQNPTGGTMRGGEGRGVLTSSRGVPGAKKTDAVVGVQNSKGSKAHKAMDDSSSCADDVSSGDDAASSRSKPPMKKSLGSVRGTEFVQYIDYGDAPGSDASIAKSIAEAQGALGQQATQPMDLNNDLSRLLV